MTKIQIDDDPIVIELGDNLIAWISQEDAEIAGWGWVAKKAGYAPNFHYYAIDRQNIGGTRIDIFLHNEIWKRMMGIELPKNFLVDHINNDKLDCRRSNLRLATRSDNEANKKKRRGKTSSKYKGVSLMKNIKKKPWRATLTFEKKQIALGTFATEREAAIAYNTAALENYGEFAYINEIEDEEKNN